MRKPKAYEVQVRVRVRVLASDEDEATRAVSEAAAERLTAVLGALHADDPRFAGFCLLADELVEELD